MLCFTTSIFSYASSHIVKTSLHYFDRDRLPQSVAYSYQQISSTYQYINYSVASYVNTDNDFLGRTFLQIEKGLYINSLFKKFVNTKGYCDLALKLGSNQNDYIAFLGIKLGVMSRLTDVFSLITDIQYFLSSSNEDNHLNFSFGIHYFRGAGLNTEYKTDRLKKKKRGILRFL